MKILQSIHTSVQKMLSQPSKIDGRIWVLISLVSYFSFLWLANFFVSYQEVWRKLRVPTMNPSFADLRGVLAGFECTRLGYDVLLENPCDPWNRGIIYPRIWWKLTGLGLDQSHTVVLGILLAIAFYLITFAIIGRLNLYEGIIYSLILCSPPVMLLIERGNVDILLYMMIFLSLTLAQSRRTWVRILGYIALLIPTFLKILPVFSLMIILKEKRRIFISFFLSLLTISALYIYKVREELSVAKEYLGIKTGYSFGYKILLNELLSRLSPSFLLERKLNLIYLIVAPLLFIGLVALAFLIVTHFLPTVFKDINNSSSLTKQNVSLSEKVINNDKVLDGFRIGSSLYLGTFIATVSFDYKLAFLIFAIPQIIIWVKQNHIPLAIPSTFALLGVVATLYLSPLFHPFLIDELVNYFLWFYFLYAFTLTLPNWIKLFVKNLIPTKRLA